MFDRDDELLRPNFADDPDNEPEIITAPPSIVQVVLRASLGGSGGEKNETRANNKKTNEGARRRSDHRNEVEDVTVAAGVVDPFEDESGDEAVIVTEAGDRNPFPVSVNYQVNKNVDLGQHFFATSRFKTPLIDAAVAEDRIGQQFQRGSSSAEDHPSRGKKIS